MSAKVCDRSKWKRRKSPKYEEDNDCASLAWLLNFRLDEIVNVKVPDEAPVVNEARPLAENPAVPKKPPYTYPELIERALREKGELTVSGLYQWISDRFPFYKANDERWKNSVRHNLSINPHFRKGARAPQGAGHLWSLAANAIDLLPLRNHVYNPSNQVNIVEKIEDDHQEQQVSEGHYYNPSNQFTIVERIEDDYEINYQGQHVYGHFYNASYHVNIVDKTEIMEDYHVQPVFEAPKPLVEACWSFAANARDLMPLRNGRVYIDERTGETIQDAHVIECPKVIVLDEAAIAAASIMPDNDFFTGSTMFLNPVSMEQVVRECGLITAD